MVSAFGNRRYIPVGNDIRLCKTFLKNKKGARRVCKALSGASAVWIQKRPRQSVRRQRPQPFSPRKSFAHPHWEYFINFEASLALQGGVVVVKRSVPYRPGSECTLPVFRRLTGTGSVQRAGSLRCRRGSRLSSRRGQLSA